MQTQRGSTLIEIIVATGIVGFVMITLVSLIAVSVRHAALAQERALATKFGQEGMEFFRRERDFVGWETFVSTLINKGGTVTFCLPSIPDTATAFSAVPTGACNATQFADTRGIFQRSAVLTVKTISTGVYEVDVTVTLNWNDSGLPQSSALYETLRQPT